MKQTPKEWLKKFYMDAYLRQVKIETKTLFDEPEEEDMILLSYYLKKKYSHLATLPEKIDTFIKQHMEDKKVSFSVNFYGEKKSVEIKLRW